MQGVELATVPYPLLHEAAAIPNRAFQQHRQMLDLVPGQKLIAIVVRSPQPDMEQPGAAGLAETSSSELRCQRFSRSAAGSSGPVRDHDSAAGTVAHKNLG